MNLPAIKPYEERAIDLVVNVLNRANTKFCRMNLFQLAQSRDVFKSKYNIPFFNLGSPLAIKSEKLVEDIIEKHWKLTPMFMYMVKYTGSSRDESAHYYYLEAIFSQPTASYPIPQATCSVFFRVEDKHIEPPEIKGNPKMYFRVEGHNTDNCVRSVYMSPDRILAVIKMKINLSKKIEAIKMF